jgi:hypothetical protein
MKKTYVVAGNYVMFRGWCKDQGLDERAPNLVFVVAPEVLYGLRGHEVEIVETPTARSHPAFSAIHSAVLRLRAEARA